MPTYPAFAFRQNSASPLTLIFVAPSCEIDEWAKVPTRLSNQPHNFQRAAIPGHVAEIKRFFAEDQSKTNSSPTSILLGVEPIASHKVVLLAEDGSRLDEQTIQQTARPCSLHLNFEPWDSSAFETVDDEILALYQEVRPIYTAPDVDAEEENEVEDGDPQDDENSVPEADEEQEDAAIEGLGPEESAEKFLAAIPSDQICQIVESEIYKTWTSAQKKVLRDLFRDDLKPCLIIDGQHRVKGTKDLQDIPFSVSLLPRADWAELAFQFIVNNSSSRKVDENLLFGIVGQSLNPEQLGATEVRLNRAGIKVSLIKAAMRVQLEPNPFTGMIKTNTPGERGFIDATALQKKVIELWYGSRGRTGLKPAFKNFCAIRGKRKKWSMAELFGSCTEGSNAVERARNWQDDVWFSYFRAFWEAVSSHFVGRLWPQTQDEWLPNDTVVAAMTPAQKERQKLMRATVLGLLQKALLQAWADYKSKELRKANSSFANLKMSPEEFKQDILPFVKTIPMDFFTELKFTGFDASGDLRDEMSEYMLAIIEDSKSFPEIKQTRFWQAS